MSALSASSTDSDTWHCHKHCTLLWLCRWCSLQTYLLVCLQDEISEMKRKFKIMSHQIEQLKEEIAAKDLALVKEHFDHMKVRLQPGGILLHKAYDIAGKPFAQWVQQS